MIILKLHAIYKDGGSHAYIDEYGNKYWRNFAFSDRSKSTYGIIYIGDINNKKRVIATGIFKIPERIVSIRNAYPGFKTIKEEIIKQ